MSDFFMQLFFQFHPMLLARDGWGTVALWKADSAVATLLSSVGCTVNGPSWVSNPPIDTKKTWEELAAEAPVHSLHRQSP